MPYLISNLWKSPPRSFEIAALSSFQLLLLPVCQTRFNLIYFLFRYWCFKSSSPAAFLIRRSYLWAQMMKTATRCLLAHKFPGASKRCPGLMERAIRSSTPGLCECGARYKTNLRRTTKIRSLNRTAAFSFCPFCTATTKTIVMESKMKSLRLRIGLTSLKTTTKSVTQYLSSHVPTWN